MKRTSVLYIDAMALVPVRRSGVGHYVHNIVTGLDQLGEPYILFVTKGKKRLLSNRYPTASIKEIPVPSRLLKALDLIGLAPQIDRFIGSGIYFFGNFENWPLTRRSASITCIHDVAFMRYPGSIESKNLFYLQRFIQRWVRRTTALVTVSYFSSSEIKALLKPKQTIDIVSNSISNHFMRVQARSLKIVSSYGITCSNPLLFVGNIEPRKGLQGFFTWYAQQSDDWQSKNPIVLIGGDGWGSEDVLRLIALINRRHEKPVIQRPARYVDDDDLTAFFTEARAVILPSIYEGYGVPVIEAMYVQKPLIAANFDALNEVIASIDAKKIAFEDEVWRASPYNYYIHTTKTKSKIPTSKDSATQLMAVVRKAYEKQHGKVDS